jgi:hypothetical protein
MAYPSRTDDVPIHIPMSSSSSSPQRKEHLTSPGQTNFDRSSKAGVSNITNNRYAEHDSESEAVLRPTSSNNARHGEHDSDSEFKSILRPTSSSASPQRKNAVNLTSHVGCLNSGHSKAKRRATATAASTTAAATAMDLRNPPRSGGVEKRIMEMMGEVCVCMYVCVYVCTYCMNIYLCVCVCVRVCACVFWGQEKDFVEMMGEVCVCMYVCAVWMCVCVHMYVRDVWIYICVCVCACV